MDRNYLKGRDGDRANAALAAAGYNFALLLSWLARLLRAFFRLLLLPAFSIATRAQTPLGRFSQSTLWFESWRSTGCCREVGVQSRHARAHRARILTSSWSLYMAENVAGELLGFLAP